ncbi:MAG: VOC family protein [Acidimicrobiales bacterium]
MRVKGLNWMGVETTALGEMTRLFTEVMGLQVARDQPNCVAFRLPDGDELEIFGAGGSHPPEQFASNKVEAGLLVDDIEQASTELAAAGLRLIGERQYGEGGFAWQHFQAPDGKVFQLAYDPHR